MYVYVNVCIIYIYIYIYIHAVTINIKQCLEFARGLNKHAIVTYSNCSNSCAGPLCLPFWSPKTPKGFLNLNPKTLKPQTRNHCISPVFLQLLRTMLTLRKILGACMSVYIYIYIYIYLYNIYIYILYNIYTHTYIYCSCTRAVIASKDSIQATSWLSWHASNTSAPLIRCTDLAQWHGDDLGWRWHMAWNMAWDMAWHGWSKLFKWHMSCTCHAHVIMTWGMSRAAWCGDFQPIRPIGQSFNCSQLRSSWIHVPRKGSVGLRYPAH